jgi:translation initiation factor 2 subunit 1
MIQKDGLPETNELVICRVKTIQPHSAFLKLIEYKKREGMMHISEVASGWVKNIRAHMQENQQVVCKVLSVDRKKGFIDLSMKRVSAGERKAKLNEWKTEKRMYMLLKRVADKVKKPAQLDSVAKGIVDDFGSLAAFYAELKESDKALKEGKVPKNWADEIQNLVQEHIKSQRVRVSKTIKLSSAEGNGITRIKKIFKSLKVQDGIEASFTYLGAPNYKITVLASDYKSADDILDSMVDEIKDLARQNNVKFLDGK